MKPLFFDRPDAPAAPWARSATLLLMSVLLAGICCALLTGSVSNWDAVWSYRDVFIRGWLLTLVLASIALAVSLVIGFLVALARRSSFLPLRTFALLYVEILRGSPLLVLILFFFYVVADQAGITNRLFVGTLALSLYSGAYLAEILRSGIESISSSQLESARAIGLRTSQIYRLIIFPQAFRQTLPPLAGQFASLIKDSSLLSVIGISEFTLAAQQVNNATYSTLESFLPLAIGYLILTLPISALSRLLEKRFRYET